MVRQGIRATRVAAPLVVALIALASLAPLVSAAKRPPNGGGGFPDPSVDSVAPVFSPHLDISAVRDWVESAIQIRLLTLRLLRAQIATAPSLNAADRATFIALIQTDRSDLNALEVSVRSDNKIGQLQHAIESTITGYRIFTVVSPQIRTLISVDSVEARAMKLASSEAQIAAAVATANALGNAKAVQAAYSALVSAVSSAQTFLQNAHTTVTALVATLYTQAAQVLASANTSIASAQADLRSARDDIFDIAALLRKKLSASGLGASSSR